MATFTVRGYEDFFPELARLERDECLTISGIESKNVLVLYGIEDDGIGPLVNSLSKYAGICDFVISLQGD